MALLVLLNNFLHDFSAAGWIFCTVILWQVFKKSSLAKGADKIIINILQTIRILMQISLAGIVVFGVVRALAYKSFEYSAAAGSSQITLLIIKHILLLAVFIPGIVYYIRSGKVVSASAK